MTNILIFSLILCLLLIALLAASEAALAATNRVRLRHLLQAGSAPDDQNSAQLLSSELSGDAQRFIATVTIAANVPLLAAAALTAILAQKSYGERGALACAIVALCVVPLFQIAPRLLVSQPGALDRLWWVKPARLLVTLMRPAVQVLLFLGVLLLRPLGLLPARKNLASEEESGLANAEEIRDLVETAQASGAMEEGGKELIESIFDFGDTRVREVMIPRPDILALPMEACANEVMDVLQESGFSRLPLHEGSVDRIAGVLYAKDVLGALSRNELDFSPRALMREAIYLPESQKIDEALASMRGARNHMAIVMDEYGGTAGLLTVEDILEELVGEIADEHDAREDEPLKILDENTAVVDARLHTDDLESQWGLALPTGAFDSVGGFMIEQLGRALDVDDRLELPNAVLIVQHMRGRRPRTILIHRKTEEPEDE